MARPDDKKAAYAARQLFDKEELKRLESLCVQGEAPACQAACPLHVDSRLLCFRVAEGDFAKGRALLDTASSFSALLAFGCDAPCSRACRLDEVGDGIDVCALEQACVSLAPHAKLRRLPMAAKPARIAVLGQDLFALALAEQLERKAYRVTLHLPGKDLAEGLGSFAGRLPASLIEGDLDAFRALDIDMVYSSRETWDSLKSQYDLVGVGPGQIPDDVLAGLDRRLGYSPVHGILACGPDWGSGAAGILAAARASATTADHLLQATDPHRNREREGPYKTRLFTSLEGIAGSKKLTHAGSDEAQSRQEAIAEAGRCISCECLECVKGCEYLAHFKRYPGSAIREVYNNLSIVMGERTSNSLVNACALCSQCEKTCPQGLDFGQICSQARRTMDETGHMPARAFEFALNDMAFSMGPDAFFASPASQAKAVFFPGCQLPAVYPETAMKTYQALNEAFGGGVGIVAACCGIPARWAGRQAEYGQNIDLLKRALAEYGEARIIAACPTCLAALRQEGFNAEGVWEALSGSGLASALPVKVADKVAIHDACGTRDDSRARQGIREMIASLGYAIQEGKYSGEKTPCCGYGGLAYFSDMAVSDGMAAYAAKNATDFGQTPVVSYCANCASRLSDAGARSFHLLELAFGPEPAPARDFSERRENRRAFKRGLMALFSQDPGHDANNPGTVAGHAVRYSKAALSAMRERLLLAEDVEAVLSSVAQGAACALDSEGVFHASLRIGAISVWVSFTRTETGDYEVNSVYSHRMSIRAGS